MPPWEQLESLIPRVYRFALRLAADANLAEDLTQETFLKAWQKRSGLREQRSARVWLFQILVNLWRDHLRQNQRRPKVESSEDSPIDPNSLPSKEAENREELFRVLKAVEQLPPRQREVLHLAAVEELKTNEIAQILGITENSVKANLSKARKTMRQTFPSHDPANSAKLK